MQSFVFTFNLTFDSWILVALSQLVQLTSYVLRSVSNSLADKHLVPRGHIRCSNITLCVVNQGDGDRLSIANMPIVSQLT